MIDDAAEGREKSDGEGLENGWRGEERGRAGEERVQRGERGELETNGRAVEGREDEGEEKGGGLRCGRASEERTSEHVDREGGRDLQLWVRGRTRVYGWNTGAWRDSCDAFSCQLLLLVVVRGGRVGPQSQERGARCLPQGAVLRVACNVEEVHQVLLLLLFRLGCGRVWQFQARGAERLCDGNVTPAARAAVVAPTLHVLLDRVRWDLLRRQRGLSVLTAALELRDGGDKQGQQAEGELAERRRACGGALLLEKTVEQCEQSGTHGKEWMTTGDVGVVCVLDTRAELRVVVVDEFHGGLVRLFEEVENEELVEVKCLLWMM